MIFAVGAPDAKTLGDILYADKSKVRVSEDECLQLVRAVAGGDQRALHSLYEQTHRIVFTLIVRITANRETAEEVTLDVFYEVWQKASAYDPANGSVVGWIMNQARSRAIDRLRFDQRKKRVNTYPHSLRPTTDIVDPQQACLFEEQSRLLRNALEVLTSEERNAIETAFFSELTHEETARKLNQPLGTVKTRIRSGMGKLREALGGKRPNELKTGHTQSRASGSRGPVCIAGASSARDRFG
jgi:RNA polymerase sigma-70 factor, ECF subfamily